MKNINIPYFTIRLLTVACYFLPFIFFLSTCTTDLDSEDAYNRTDAIANEKEEYELKLKSFETFEKDTSASYRNAAFPELLKRSKNLCFSSTKRGELENNGLLREWVWRIIFPSSFSISGIGAILFHKNTLDKILVSISILLSLITLLLWRFLHKRKWAIIIISINIGTVVAFILSGLLSNVQLLYGTWTLLFLLIVQLLTEMQLLRTRKTKETTSY